MQGIHQQSGLLGAVQIGVTALALGGNILAADIYVSTNGTQSASYASWATAFTNVQEALDYATPGDTIYLAGQAFAATQIEWSVSSVTILGGYEADPGSEPGEYDSLKWRTILTIPPGMASRVMRIAGVTNGTLRRVDVRGGRIDAHGAGLHISDSENLVISDCRLVDNDSIYSSYGGGLYAFNTSGVLSNAVLAANVAYAHTDGRGMGGYIEGGNWLFHDVACVANHARENWGYLKGAASTQRDRVPC